MALYLFWLALKIIGVLLVVLIARAIQLHLKSLFAIKRLSAQGIYERDWNFLNRKGLPENDQAPRKYRHITIQAMRPSW